MPPSEAAEKARKRKLRAAGLVSVMIDGPHGTVGWVPRKTANRFVEQIDMHRDVVEAALEAPRRPAGRPRKDGSA